MMQLRVILMCVLTAIGASTAAQEIPCRVQFPKREQLAERVSCLENAIDTLAAIVATYRRQQVSADSSLSTTVNDRLISRFGPRKTVVTIPSGIFLSDGYWSGRSKNPKHFYCENKRKPKQPTGTIQFGAAETKDKYRQERQGEADKARQCVKSGEDCRGGEVCRSSVRAPGCYVNKDWYAWAASNMPGGAKALTVDIVCSISNPLAKY